MESPDAVPVDSTPRMSSAHPLDKWILCAKQQLARFLQKSTTVVTLIGKDLPNRSKAEDINDTLRMTAFSIPMDGFSKLGIDVFYASSLNVLFLVLNSPSDVSNLSQVFCAENSAQNFFEKLKASEEEYLKMLHFASIVSHIILFLEPLPRFDMSLARTLKTANKMRLSCRSKISEALYESKNTNISEDNRLVKDGRLALPRLLFAFQKTLIRTELGHSKKREINMKLEGSLEDQIYNVLKQCRLIENGTGPSFGYIPSEKDGEHYVRLLPPGPGTHNPMSDMVDFILGKGEETEEEKVPSTDGFAKFLSNQLSSVRQDKHRALPLPTLGTLIALFDEIYHSLWNEDSFVEMAATSASKELKLMKDLTRLAINEAVDQYSWQFGKEKERSVFTKAEHIQRFGSAVSYLDSVLVGPRDQAMAELRSRCDSLWQGGLQCCEQQSITGSNCLKPVHPCVGDNSVAEKQWELHDSGVTFISTCTCGRSQHLRRDPFSLKEANYDFYFANAKFPCCKGLERHGFAVVDDDEEEVELDKEEAWNGEEDWPRPGGGSNPVDDGRPSKRLLRDRSNEISEESAGTNSEKASSDDDSEEADAYWNGNAYSSSPKISYKDPADLRRNAIHEFMKKQKKLDSRKTPYLPGVPHSESPAVPPIFPSWSLTCIGPSSIYSHAVGLRDQPNFKIACEYLLPVDVQFQVDPDVWEQDMDYVNALEGAGYMSYRKPKNKKFDNERVKLFVGFDYECPRGHRFFVGSDGEPLVLPKGPSAREAACRDAGLRILESDLPLRRQCTCRKLPNQPAQLMKIHIVTPKAPVSVTVDPKVFLPNESGYFHTGEGPLQLAWAKYYILQLPHTYSGPNGLWIPPKNLERMGMLKGNSIQVTYTPLERKEFWE